MHRIAAIVMLTLCATALAQNTQPATPAFNEPQQDDLVLNPADVHLECTPFSDADPGDIHLCTDWEIWTIAPSARVWASQCATGLESIHAHLGDGAFEGTLNGATQLDYDTQYLARARHRDDSGDVNQWSEWAERPFVTGSQTSLFPLEAQDVLELPVPSWIDALSRTIPLPTSAVPASVRVENGLGEALITFSALDGISNQVDNAAGLADHGPVRVRISAGTLPGGLQLPESELRFTDSDGEEALIYLPAINALPGADVFIWVTSSGATYLGAAGQTEPDFSTLLRSLPIPWRIAQPGFRVDRFASGFRMPVNIAFVPNPGPNADDPYFYVTELYGSIKVVLRDGTVQDYAAGLLNYDPGGAFPGSGEQGVSGLVVDPNNGDVIVAYLYDDGGPHYPRVSRFSSIDGGRTANNETVLLDMVGESQGQSHQISTVSIGPDGMLYVHMGDGFDTARAQDLSSFRGKILRIALNGDAPTDNPLYDASDGIGAADHVYTYGLRNPFGGAWRDADNSLYTIENGPSVDRIAKMVPARNYLWSGSNASMRNFAVYNWEPATGPVNGAFIQNSRFNGSLFPAEKMDHLFVTESGPTYASGPQSRGKRITEFVLDAQGNLVSGPNLLVEYVGVGRATAVGLAAGPDGLYFTDLYEDTGANGPTGSGATILRVSFQGAADFTADITAGDAPLTVQFTDQSTVPGASAWQWTFGDGNTSDLQNPSHTYTQDGLYDVRLTVTGTNGVQITQRVGFIRVGEIFGVAIIGGTPTASMADQAIADHLSSLGYGVQVFDDDPGLRPDAAALADAFDLVVISSTVTSGNIASEFRNRDVPLIFWEQALLNTDRIPLTNGGAVLADQQAIAIVNNTHPITAGLPIANVDVFSPGANMSVGNVPVSGGAQILARRAGALDAALMTADTGATLLNGYIAPARRVFMFLEDSSWMNITDEGRTIFDRAACWAMDLDPPSILAEPQDVTVPAGQTVVLSVSAQGASPLSYRWRRNGQLLPGLSLADLVIENATPADSGLYEVQITNACGDVISRMANVSIECAADFTADGQVDIADLLTYLSFWFVQDPAAEFTGDVPASVNVADLLSFLSLWFEGC